MFAVGGGRRTVSSRGSPSRTISNLLCIGFGGAVSVMGTFLGLVTHRGYFVLTIVTVTILATMACCSLRRHWCRLLTSIARRQTRGHVNKTSPGVPSASCSVCSSTYIRMEAVYGGRSVSLPNTVAWNFREHAHRPVTRTMSAP